MRLYRQPRPGFSLTMSHNKAVAICLERLAQECTNRLLHRRLLSRWPAQTHRLSRLLEVPTRLCLASKHWSTVRLLDRCLPLLLHPTAPLAMVTAPRVLEISLVTRSALGERICVLFDNSTGCSLLKLPSLLPPFFYILFFFILHPDSALSARIFNGRECLTASAFNVFCVSMFGVCTEVARLFALL